MNHYQYARRNDGGGAFANRDDVSELHTEISRVNGLKDKEGRPCFEVTLQSTTINREDLLKSLESNDLTMFEGHGGKTGPDGRFIDDERRHLGGGGSYTEDAIEKYAETHGPTNSGGCSASLGELGSTGRFRSYSCGGDISPDHRVGSRGAFRKMAADLEGLEAGDCCKKPKKVNLTFGPLTP
jgi:hypothetical protein